MIKVFFFYLLSSNQGRDKLNEDVRGENRDNVRKDENLREDMREDIRKDIRKDIRAD